METINKETYWSRFAENYEEKQRHVVGKELFFLTRDEMLKETDFGKVLELGCGTGLYTEILVKNSTGILATDFSDEMIAAAKQKRGNPGNVKFKKANAKKINVKYI